MLSDSSTISIFDPSAIADNAGIPQGWVMGPELGGGTAASDYWHGYIGDMAAGDFGLMPTSLSNGSSGTKYCDYVYRRVTLNRVALFGGYSNNGANCGAFACHLYYVLSYRNWHYGASRRFVKIIFTNRSITRRFGIKFPNWPATRK